MGEHRAEVAWWQCPAELFRRVSAGPGLSWLIAHRPQDTRRAAASRTEEPLGRTPLAISYLQLLHAQSPEASPPPHDDTNVRTGQKTLTMGMHGTGVGTILPHSTGKETEARRARPSPWATKPTFQQPGRALEFPTLSCGPSHESEGPLRYSAEARVHSQPPGSSPPPVPLRAIRLDPHRGPQ